jgi:predicted nucleic acid-binding protein
MRQFMRGILSSGMLIEQVNRADLERASEILDRYADTQLDFVDATIMAIAERLDIVRILTVDQRHFRTLRPKHCPAFEILP